MKRCLSTCPHATTRPTVTTTPRSFDEIPGPPKKPLMGNYSWRSDSSLRHQKEYLLSLFEKYGPIVKRDLGFGQGHMVYVFDPEDSRTVFSVDGKQPHIVPLQETTQKYREMRGMNPGLGNLNGEEWYRLRSAVQQEMMRPQAVHKYLPFVNKVSTRLIDHINESKNDESEVDMKRISGRWSLESAGLIVFERRLGALEKNVEWADRLVDVNSEIFQLSSRLGVAMPLYKYFTTPKWKRIVELEDIFYGEADRLMTEAIETLKSGEGEEDMKFASALINNKNLSVKDVKVILLSLFSDGLSTTAPMLVYNLFNIAKNQQIQDELREEINKVCPKSEDLTAAMLTRLPLLRACIKETFRLFPIGVDVSRIPQKDVELSGFQIPAFTPISICTNVLMSSSTVFPNPTVFDPSRWMRDSKKEVHPFFFLPFGFGPRMCAGRRFAEQDLHAVLARLVQSPLKSMGPAFSFLRSNDDFSLRNPKMKRQTAELSTATWGQLLIRWKIPIQLLTVEKACLNFRICHQRGEVRQKYETLLLPEGDCRFQFHPL